MLTRRQFGRGVLAGAGTLVFPSLTACSRPEKVDAVIIGAGLSGLNTARLLSQSGMSVMVLEAGDQAGGRMRTLQTVDGPLDIGASQIGRGYARVRSLCRELDVTLVPENRDLHQFGMHFLGQWIDAETWADNPLNQCTGDERQIPPFMMGRAMIGRYNPLESLDDWLKPEFAEWDISLRQLMQREGHSEQAIEFAAATVPGISADGTSLLRMFQESVRAKYEMRFAPKPSEDATNTPIGEANSRSEDGSIAAIYNVAGGCQRLPEAIAGNLGDRVRYGRKVAQIEMKNTGARVRCIDGGIVDASFVVSAVPFTMLRDVDIHGDRPGVSRTAIDSMPYANTSRLYVEVTEPFWDIDELPPSFSTDTDMGMFWVVKKNDPAEQQRAMFVLVGGAGQRISKHPDPESFLIAELERVRPAAKGHVRKIAYKDWATDPLQKGCGFSLGPGHVNSYARDMLKPWGAMHFAGEHTRRMDFGMESAMESSERVAIEILSRVKV